MGDRLYFPPERSLRLHIDFATLAPAWITLVVNRANENLVASGLQLDVHAVKRCFIENQLLQHSLRVGEKGLTRLKAACSQALPGVREVATDMLAHMLHLSYGEARVLEWWWTTTMSPLKYPNLDQLSLPNRRQAVRPRERTMCFVRCCIQYSVSLAVCPVLT